MKFASLNSTTQLNNNSTNSPMSLATGQSVLGSGPSNDWRKASICDLTCSAFSMEKGQTVIS